MLRNDVVDLYYCLYGRRKPPCLSGAIYQRVAEVPRTAMENAEVIPGIIHHVSVKHFTIDSSRSFESFLMILLDA